MAASQTDLMALRSEMRKLVGLEDRLKEHLDEQLQPIIDMERGLQVRLTQIETSMARLASSADAQSRSGGGRRLTPGGGGRVDLRRRAQSDGLVWRRLRGGGDGGEGSVSPPPVITSDSGMARRRRQRRPAITVSVCARLCWEGLLSREPSMGLSAFSRAAAFKTEEGRRSWHGRDGAELVERGQQAEPFARSARW